MSSKDLKIFKTFRIRSEELLRDSIEFLISKFKQSRKMFSVSSVYGQILYVLENLFQLNLFYIEDSISEMNIHTSSRNASKYSLTALAGHNPSRAISASGEVLVKPRKNPEVEVPGNVVILPNYRRIMSENNGKTYVLSLPSDDIRIPLDQEKPVKIHVKQGRLETQIFTGKGVPFESIAVPYPTNFFIDNFDVEVYVNDTKWKRFESLVHMPSGERGYMIRTGVNSGIEIYFGNGKMGVNPELGDEIRVEYLVTDGFSGRINESVKEDVRFIFLDSGFTLLGEEVDVNELLEIKTEVIPDYGINPEDINFTVKTISRRDDALIRIPNYEVLLKRMGHFSIVRVYQKKDDERMIIMFLVPDVSKTVQTKEGYFDISLDSFKLTEEKKRQLMSFLNKMGTNLIATDFSVVDPVVRKYVINVSLIVFEGYDPDIIKNDIKSVVSEYFMSLKRRDRVPKSDIMREIEKVDGVDSVNVRIVGELNEKSKSKDPVAGLVGLDQFNDIVMEKNELPVIRGGFQDREGNYYSEGLSEDDNMGALNIRIDDIVREVEKENA